MTDAPKPAYLITILAQSWYDVFLVDKEAFDWATQRDMGMPYGIRSDRWPDTWNDRLLTDSLRKRLWEQDSGLYGKKPERWEDYQIKLTKDHWEAERARAAKRLSFHKGAFNHTISFHSIGDAIRWAKEKGYSIEDAHQADNQLHEKALELRTHKHGTVRFSSIDRPSDVALYKSLLDAGVIVHTIVWHGFASGGITGKDAGWGEERTRPLDPERDSIDHIGFENLYIQSDAFQCW